LLVGDDGEVGEPGEGEVLFLLALPPAPDELLEPPLAPVPPVSAGRSQPVRSAPERAKARARARVSVRVISCGSFRSTEPSNKQTH
jgi:hypothetical protein